MRVRLPDTSPAHLDPFRGTGPRLASGVALERTPSNRSISMKRPELHTRRAILAGATALATTHAVDKALALPIDQTEEEGALRARRLLVLGGTRFLGPVIVRAALDAGWEVTLFNRGKSNPGLFKDLEQRVGDRNTSDYASLATGAWDLVVDTSCYIPGHVTAAIEALDGRAGHYLVVSTLSVYTNSTPEKGPREFAETDPVATIEPERLLEFSEIGDVGKYGSRYYGALKALCEEAARKALPGAVTVVRPGLIVGPGDISDRFTYWAVRVAEGGRIMAPGDPGAPVQYVDVRDLGTFIFETGARRSGKVINAVGFDRPVTMRDALASCIPAEQSADGARFTWVSDEFLMAQEIAPWLGLPLWIPGSPDTYSNSVARKEGLRFRPLAETAAATLAWHRRSRGGDHRWRAGIRREKEISTLEAWDAR